MAELGGFEKPIIHGLCTYGFTARSIYEKYCNDDPTALKKYAARFTSHAFPGETFIVDSWKEGNTIIFETRTKERGKVILRGYAELKPQAKI
jgi:peroxisomal enoyl-CoA hydratase 2